MPAGRSLSLWEREKTDASRMASLPLGEGETDASRTVSFPLGEGENRCQPDGLSPFGRGGKPMPAGRSLSLWEMEKTDASRTVHSPFGRGGE